MVVVGQATPRLVDDDPCRLLRFRVRQCVSGLDWSRFLRLFRPIIGQSVVRLRHRSWRLAHFDLGSADLGSLWQQPWLLLMSALPAIYGLASAAALLALFAGLATLFYDSPDAALAQLRGERISLYPRLADVGTGRSRRSTRDVGRSSQSDRPSDSIDRRDDGLNM